MGKLRIIISIILIAAGVCLLLYWESTGREAFLTEEVLITSVPIPRGTSISPEHLETALLSGDTLIQNPLRPEDLRKILGKTAAVSLPEKSQLSSLYFQEDLLTLKGDQSLFSLDPEWITMRSSSLRRGDLVDIYEDQTYSLLGRFPVAFVKDSTEGEVQNTEGSAPGEILDRTSSTSVISHIEIIASPAEYFAIRNAIQNDEDGNPRTGLILVQKEH